MFTDAVLVAVVGALAAILVELIRSRRQQSTVVDAVTPNGGSSMRDAVDRVAADVRELRTQQGRNTARIASVEAILSERRRSQ